MSRRRLPALRAVSVRAGVLAVLLAVTSSQVSTAAAGLVPGADASPAILRETTVEASNPSGPDRLPELKNRAAGAIALRQVRLAVLAKSITTGSAKKADCAQAVVIPLLTSEVVVLNALGEKLAADTDLKKARENYRRIFTDSRVFLLHNSRVFLVDTCLTLQVRTQRLAARLAESPIEATESTRLAGLIGQVSNDSRVVIVPLLTLVPDRGDKAMLAVNSQALNDAGDALKVMQQTLNDVDAALDGAKKAAKGQGKAQG